MKRLCFNRGLSFLFPVLGGLYPHLTLAVGFCVKSSKHSIMLRSGANRIFHNNLCLRCKRRHVRIIGTLKEKNLCCGFQIFATRPRHFLRTNRVYGLLRYRTNAALKASGNQFFCSDTKTNNVRYLCNVCFNDFEY